MPDWAKTLKFRIVVLAVAVAVLSAAGATQLLLKGTQGDIEQMLLDNQRRDREQTAALLASKLETLQLALGAVTRQIQPSLWQDRAALAAHLINAAALHVLFDSVLAVRADGVTAVHFENGLPGIEMSRVADPEFMQRVLQTDQAVVSRPFVAGTRNAPLIMIAMPVPANEGQVAGMIAGAIDLRSNRLFSGLSRSSVDEPTRELVLDREGTILSHPDPRRLLGRAADEPGLATLAKAWIDTGRPIDTQAQATLSEGHLVARAAIPATDWSLVRLTPAESALAPLAAARRDAWRATAVVGLMAGLLAGALAWLMIRPISQLRQRAEMMLGEAGAPSLPWPQSAGEMGALSRAFQQVVEQRQRRHAEAQALLERIEAVLDYADVGIALSRDGHFELVSRQFCHIFRCEKVQVVGQSTRSIHASDAAYQALSDRARPAFMAHGAFDGELELMRCDGKLFWAHMRGRAVVPGDRSKGTIWIIEDVTEAHAQRERLVWTASHDALTGLMNRRGFEAALGEATARSAQQPFCALFIDLDRFKQVNDTGGHAAGDAVLRDVAQLLGAQVRKSDTVARLGGDEFAVLLNSCPVPQAQVIAEKMRLAVVEYRLAWEGGQAFSIGASIGLLPVDGSYAGAAAVLRAADEACYAAKRQGRNCVVVAAPNAPAPTAVPPSAPPASELAVPKVRRAETQAT